MNKPNMPTCHGSIWPVSPTCVPVTAMKLTLGRTTESVMQAMIELSTTLSPYVVQSGMCRFIVSTTMFGVYSLSWIVCCGAQSVIVGGKVRPNLNQNREAN